MSRRAINNIARLIDIDNQKSEPEQQFLSDLKRSIEINDEKGRGNIASKTFKPSSMKCKRNSYFQLIGEEQDMRESTFTMVGICNSGTDIHNRLQTAISWMKSNGMNWEYVDVGAFVHNRGLNDIVVKDSSGMETKLYNSKYNISFMCDGILRGENKYYILEIKTEVSRKWYVRDGVDPKHYNQAITYSLSLGLRDVIFLYVSRDTLDMKAYMFHVTDEMLDNIKRYMADVTSYAERHIAPPKESSVPKSECNYCAYRTKCRTV